MIPEVQINHLSDDLLTDDNVDNCDLDKELDLPSLLSSIQLDGPQEGVLTPELLLCPAGKDSRQYSEDLDVSPEAAQILDELPLLSFLRSHVLMFPVNNFDTESKSS